MGVVLIFVSGRVIIVRFEFGSEVDIFVGLFIIGSVVNGIVKLLLGICSYLELCCLLGMERVRVIYLVKFGLGVESLLLVGLNSLFVWGDLVMFILF